MITLCPFFKIKWIINCTFFLHSGITGFPEHICDDPTQEIIMFVFKNNKLIAKSKRGTSDIVLIMYNKHELMYYDVRISRRASSGKCRL